ncbi:MAG: hypothetical protein AAF745_16800 [Planctomycetota bacterium]
MKPSEPQSGWADDLERLAMNELSPTDTERLLKRIDARSENGSPSDCVSADWKTLALLLLEDRQWSTQIGIPAPPVVDAQWSPPRSPAPVRWARRGRLLMIAAIAVCGIAAFLIGRSTALPALVTETNPVRSSDPPIDETLTRPPLVDGVIGFASWDQGDRRFVTPVYTPQRMVASDRVGGASAVPTPEQRRLRRSGWRAETGQTLVSVRLKSGQRCEISMPQIQYRYVGNSVY